MNVSDSRSATVTGVPSAFVSTSRSARSRAFASTLSPRAAAFSIACSSEWVAQSISIAFYAIGFGEAITTMASFLASSNSS